jgi:DNA-binding beta-propeller fold protein YncE
MRIGRTFRLGLALVAALGLMIPAPLQAARDDSGGVADIDVIAEGLSEPRGLAFGPGGRSLYVAEAGAGGDGPCAAHPILGDACYGKTGVITRIDEKGVKTAVKNLGSIAGPIEGMGPHDVSLHGQRIAFSVGFAGAPELRAQFGRDAEKSLGYLMTAETKGGHRRGNVSRVADLVAYEDEANPAGSPVDSNPFGVLAQGKWTYVADAGGNDLLAVSRHGRVKTIAVFPDRMVPFGGGQVPMNAVPTTVVRGPGGDLYVGQLTGFPFPIGGARVYRIEKGGDPEIYADGFTNIIDIAFGRDGSLYVLEIAHNSLLSPTPEGALIKVNPAGDREIIADGLFFPGGVALGKDDEIYVTNCGVCFEDGEVLRITP